MMKEEFDVGGNRMKLLIAGDLHGSAKYAEILESLNRQLEPDWILLTGDLLYHGPRNDLPEAYAPKKVIPILNAMHEKIVAVRGNCDSEVDQMVLNFPMMADMAMIAVDGLKLCMTHGHIYGPGNPPPLAENGVLLCGHTHIGEMVKTEGRVQINPGSLALPKDGAHSYIVYQNKVFSRFSLSGTCLDEYRVD